MFYHEKEGCNFKDSIIQFSVVSNNWQVSCLKSIEIRRVKYSVIQCCVFCWKSTDVSKLCLPLAPCWFLAWHILQPWWWDDMFLWNSGWLSTVYTAWIPENRTLPKQSCENFKPCRTKVVSHGASPICLDSGSTGWWACQVLGSCDKPCLLAVVCGLQIPVDTSSAPVSECRADIDWINVNGVHY